MVEPRGMKPLHPTLQQDQGPLNTTLDLQSWLQIDFSALAGSFLLVNGLSPCFTFIIYACTYTITSSITYLFEMQEATDWVTLHWKMHMQSNNGLMWSL